MKFWRRRMQEAADSSVNFPQKRKGLTSPISTRVNKRLATKGSLSVALIDPLGQYAGNHHYTDQLARGLARSGADVTVYTVAGDVDHSPERPYRYLESFYGIYGNQSSVIRGLRFLKCLAITYGDIIKRRTDVVHIQMWTHDFRELLQIALAKLLRKNIVISVHEVKGWSSRESAIGIDALSADHECRKPTRQFKWVISQADGMVVHNKYSSDLLRSLYPTARSTAIIPLPHVTYSDPKNSLPDRSSARARLGLPKNTTIFLFFGNCRLDKGLDIAMSALREIKEPAKDIMLVSAGKMKPQEQVYFEGIARDLGLGDSLRMDIGLIPDDVAVDYFRAANAVLIPYREVAESGVAITASSYERAIIASDLPPLLAATDNGRLGHHFRTGDSHALACVMECVATTVAELDAMGALAKEKILQERDPDVIAGRMLDLYQQVLRDQKH